jgi:hypothetical protein
MVTVTARETFPYADVTRYAGQSFEASEHDATVLIMAGKVDRAAPTRQAEPDEPSDERVDQSSDGLEPAVVATRRRRSHRKDIVSEP